MKARKLPNGNLLVPKRAVGPGGIIGDGLVEVRKGTAEYKRWLPHVEATPASRGQSPHVARASSVVALFY